MKSSNATKIGHAIWVLTGLMLGGLFGEAGTGLAAEHTWAQKVDMPTARFDHSASVVDGKIYVIAGVAEDMTEAIWPTEVYDPVMDKWTTKSNIPAPRVAHSASVVDGKIYVIGGTESPTVLRSTVLEYDPATDNWTTKTPMPTPRWFLSTNVVDGKIYAIGGLPTINITAGLSTVEEYDPVTDTWTGKANMPLGVWGLCTAVVDGKIYALGGRDPAAKPYVQEYDPATDTWARKSDVPVATGNMGSVALGDKIIVIGGWVHSEERPYTTVQMYDPDTDTWTKEGDAPFLRAAFSASVVNHRIYAIGGTDTFHPLPATSTVYELTVGPPPDLNGDDRVDIDDLIILIEHWGQNEPTCDMRPMPWGDGVVDAADLEVLMSHWGQDTHFIAHWKLDETGGDIAYDSRGKNHAAVMGDPIWQRENGRVDGALQFGGIDDYLAAPFILDPRKQPFSVYAWIKDGAPGQVVLSQQTGVNWLQVDSDGTLMTELAKSGGRTPGVPLYSEAILTDGNWHRIGFVWDGSQRILYVNDIPVALDSQPNLESSKGGLVIGVGKDNQPGTFWSGLIDDIRIYSRALSAAEIEVLAR